MMFRYRSMYDFACVQARDSRNKVDSHVSGAVR
jgi:hypothetical protein